MLVFVGQPSIANVNLEKEVAKYYVHTWFCQPTNSEFNNF